MDKQIIAQDETKGRRGISEKVASRIRRGIEHYEVFGAAIVELAAGKYRVPSSTGFGSYIADLEEETCNCKDVEGHKLGICKHRVAAMVFAAKRPTYEVEEVHNSRIGAVEYELVEYRLGERSGSEGFFPTRAQAYGCKWALEGVGAAA